MGRLLFSVLVAGIAGCSQASPESQELEAQARRLEVEYELAVDLREISGIALHDDTLLAVGDAARRIARVSVADGEQLADLLDDGSGSQWEAVAVDGTGAAFVLDEQRSIVEGFDVHGALVQVAELALGELDDVWQQEANACGEGLVLLGNGHVLVAKERDPVLVVELAPEGEEAEGYRPELALLSGERFVLDAPTLHAVHHWELHGSLVERLADVSDLAVGPDGRLFVLSDEARALVQLERELSPDEAKIEARAWYDLPSRLKKPEGLAFIEGGLFPIVAIDQEDDRDDLFWLSAVTAP